MGVLDELSKLLAADVITLETAAKIEQYYHDRKLKSPNRIFIAFGILGALLVGLGIILVIAHNWDNFSRSVKTVISFLPLISGQALCGFSLLKKAESISWRENSSVFLVFSVGTCLALISQTYNIPGNTGSFLLTWTLLCIPLVYIMKSTGSAMLYLVGITAYACYTNYFTFTLSENYRYWILFLLVIPYYYNLLKKFKDSNFTLILNWMIPLSLSIVLGTLAFKNSGWMYTAYISLFGLFILSGRIIVKQNHGVLYNGYQIIGIAGTMIILYILSYSSIWYKLESQAFESVQVILAPEFIAVVFITLFAGNLFYTSKKNSLFMNGDILESVFIIFLCIFLVGQFAPPIAVLFTNLLILWIGLCKIRTGIKSNHLGILNFGLLIIMILVVCRFFDDEIPFVIRGVLFVLAGSGFFATNYRMIKNRKDEK